jgi:hypothetical protein
LKNGIFWLFPRFSEAPNPVRQKNQSFDFIVLFRNSPKKQFKPASTRRAPARRNRQINHTCSLSLYLQPVILFCETRSHLDYQITCDTNDQGWNHSTRSTRHTTLGPRNCIGVATLAIRPDKSYK